MSEWNDGLILGGVIEGVAVDQYPAEPPPGRQRHRHGEGPFAILRMPLLPDQPGLYIWTLSGAPVYVGQTRSTLRNRLGSNGYSRISTYNTFARQPGRRNGGQETNCRINALANTALREGHELGIWYRATTAGEASGAEAEWMHQHGLPIWNRQDRSRKV